MNKIIKIIPLFFIFIVFSFSTNNPDIKNYENIYLYLSQTGNYSYSGVEIGFSLLMKFSVFLGLDYYGFLIILGTITTMLLYNFTVKYSNNPSIVLIMYIIFPFFLEVVQIRNYLASLIVLNAITFLISKKYFKYCVAIIFASLFHTTSLFYLLFVLVFFSKKKLLYIVLSITGIYVVIQKYIFPKLLLLIPNGTKYIVYMDNAKITTTILFIIYFFCSLILILNLSRGAYALNNQFNHLTDKQLSMIEMIEKINIIIVFSFALIALDINFFRLYRNIIILNYILFSNTFYRYKVLKNSSIISSQILFILFSLITGFFFLYYNQFESVVKTILESIVFFSKAN